MVSIEDAVLARYSHGKKSFEVYVDPNKALKIKNEGSGDTSDLLAVNDIFKDAAKGDRAGEDSLEETFGTTSPLDVALQIIKKGSLQLTTEQRKELREKLKREIISTIVRESYNPQTKAPHTPQRIEIAMNDAGVHVDETKSAADQVDSIVAALRPILPISIQKLEIEVIVPPAYAGKSFGVLKGHGITNVEWLNDGSLKGKISIPAGIENNFYDEINDIAKGTAKFRKLHD